MKLSGREKLYVKLVVLTLVVWGFMEIWEVMTAAQDKMEREIKSKKADIEVFQAQLENQDADTYLAQAADLEEQLIAVRQKVIELPKEEEASLVVRSAISDRAESTGMNINSINVRKSKTLDEETALREVHTYFGYDTDLVSLLRFFATMEEAPYYVAIESLTISARRQPRRTNNNRRGKNNRRNVRQRKPINGNAILRTLYMPNPNGKIETYEFEMNPNLEMSDEEKDEDANSGESKSDNEAASSSSTGGIKKVSGGLASKAGAGIEDPEPDDSKVEGPGEDDELDDDSDDNEPEPVITPIPTKKTGGLQKVPDSKKKIPTFPGVRVNPENTTELPTVIGGNRDSQNSADSKTGDQKGNDRTRKTPLEDKAKPISGPRPRKQRP